MKPQNQEIGMPGLNETAATPLLDLQIPSKTTVSSLAVHLSLSSMSYWHTSEAKNG
jgi:hypothetical protein